MKCQFNNFILNKILFFQHFVVVSSMNRMVNQLNTVQDATEVRKQL